MTLIHSLLLLLLFRRASGGDVDPNSNPTNVLDDGEKLNLPTQAQLVSPSESLLWGPGLRPHQIILPTRYFYIRLKGKGGGVLNRTDVERDDLGLRIDCGGDHGVWTQVLEKGGGDASFIVRYKVLSSCTNQFRIIVTYKQNHIANSPLIFNLPVHPDSCNCPQLETKEWLESVGCPGTYTQLTSDLSPFPNSSVNFPHLLQRILDTYHRPTSHSFCHYAIVRNEIHRKCYGEHTGFHIFPDAILLFLTRRMWNPDVEFVMNLGDWALVSPNQRRDPLNPPFPIFSWSKGTGDLDILLPTYELTEASLEVMGRVSVDMLSVQGNSGVPWPSKIPQLFWRGRDSREERLALISLGRTHPHLLNVSLTNFFFFRDKEEVYGPKTPHVSFFDFFKFKYQLSIDGTVAAYRFPFLLGGDSVVFKVDSPYQEHFYSQLSPWTHYIPLKRDLGDLLEKVKWAQENDDEVKGIGERGRKYAEDHLMPLDVVCYHATAYLEWSRRLVGGVIIGPGMDQVPQPHIHQTHWGNGKTCNCQPTEPPDFDHRNGKLEEL